MIFEDIGIRYVHFCLGGHACFEHCVLRSFVFWVLMYDNGSSCMISMWQEHSCLFSLRFYTYFVWILQQYCFLLFLFPMKCFASGKLNCSVDIAFLSITWNTCSWTFCIKVFDKRFCRKCNGMFWYEGVPLPVITFGLYDVQVIVAAVYIYIIHIFWSVEMSVDCWELFWPTVEQLMKATTGHLTGDRGNIHYSKFLDGTVPGRSNVQQA